jgi:CRP-like cAMP-binding protein
MAKIPTIITEYAKRAQQRFIPRHLADPQPAKKQPRHVKGVHKGRFFRYKVAQKKKEPAFKVVELPTPSQAPSNFKPVPPPEPIKSPAALRDQVKAWWKENWGTLVLNFGSVCTLVGFTRSDVVELRSLSMTGSLSFVVYQLTQQPRQWVSILWSSLFATVNGVKILQVLEERTGQVVMSESEEELYDEFFLPNGMTPKQFEMLMRAGTRVKFKKGEKIVEKGQTMKHVFLVVKGPTRAINLGRHSTVVSSKPLNKETKIGGDAGAWIGEMSFLEFYWEKEQAKVKPALLVAENENESSKQEKKGKAKFATRSKAPHAGKAIYTVIASDDCEILRWDYEAMEQIMGRSSDMRGAMTRVMTAAIVGKVINFTVARKTTVVPTWSTWLDDIRFKGGATVQVSSRDETDEAGESQSPAGAATAFRA